VCVCLAKCWPTIRQTHQTNTPPSRAIPKTEPVSNFNSTLAIHRPLVRGETAWRQIYHGIVCRLHSQCGAKLREGCLRSIADSTTGGHQARECQRRMLRYVWFSAQSLFRWFAFLCVHIRLSMCVCVCVCASECDSKLHKLLAKFKHLLFNLME